MQGDNLDIKFNPCLFKVGKNSGDAISSQSFADDVIDWVSNMIFRHIHVVYFW